MNILVTGSNGFIGRNLIKYLKSHTNHRIYEFSKQNLLNDLKSSIKSIDIVFHFAGINRSNKDKDFDIVNVKLTKKICNILEKNSSTSLYYASSTQVFLDNPYGRSKKKGEKVCLDFAQEFKNKVFILRLPGIFGYGCKPNYNSVVATFCFNVANNLELNIINPKKEIELVYIDDLCKQLNSLINNENNSNFIEFRNKYKITIEKLALTIKNFKDHKDKERFKKNGKFLEKCLYKTYLSYKN